MSGREETVSGLGHPGETSWKGLPALIQASGLRRMWMTEEGIGSV